MSFHVNGFEFDTSFKSFNSNAFLQNLVESLKRGEPMIHTTLTSLGEMALHLPSLFETKHKDIVREFVVKDLLMKDLVGFNINYCICTLSGNGAFEDLQVSLINCT